MEAGSFLGRLLHHLIKIVNELNNKNIGLISLNDPINTTTAQGWFMFNLFASLAEFKHNIIYKCTIAGLKSTRGRGTISSRPRNISDDAKQKACVAEVLYKQNELTSDQIAKQLKISKPILYKYLKYINVQIGLIQQRLKT